MTRTLRNLLDTKTAILLGVVLVAVWIAANAAADVPDDFVAPVIHDGNGEAIPYEMLELGEDSLVSVRVSKEHISHKKADGSARTYLVEYRRKKYPVRGTVRSLTQLERFTRSLARTIYGGSLEDYEIGWVLAQTDNDYFVTVVKGSKHNLGLLFTAEIYSLIHTDYSIESGHSHSCRPDETILHPSKLDFVFSSESIVQTQVISCRDEVFEFTKKVFIGVPI